MLDFVRENFDLLDQIILIIPAIVGIILYKKFKNTTVKYFIWFLIYVASFNFISSYPRYFASYEILNSLREYVEGTVFQRNYWWIMFCWDFGIVIFFTFYYRRILSNNKFIKFLKLIRLLFLIISTIYSMIFWNDLYYNFLNFISFFSTIVIVFCVIFYFIEILQSDKLIEFYKSINFYISIIIFIWLLMTTPLIFFNVYFRAEDWNIILLQWQIYLLANIFMYVGFALALIFGKPEKSINE